MLISQNLASEGLFYEQTNSLKYVTLSCNTLLNIIDVIKKFLKNLPCKEATIYCIYLTNRALAKISKNMW